MRPEVLRFVQADAFYSREKAARDTAEARFKTAFREFTAAWEALTRAEQKALTAAYEALDAPTSAPSSRTDPS